jgi:hypothetical protein
MASHDPLDKFEDVLHLLTPGELAEVERLLNPPFFASLPNNVLVALQMTMDQLQLHCGAPPANCISAAKEDAVLFHPETGAPLPYADWYSRRTGLPLTDEEKERLGPLAAWDPEEKFPVSEEEALALLPDGVRRRYVEARARGYWLPLPS